MYCKAYGTCDICLPGRVPSPDGTSCISTFTDSNYRMFRMLSSDSFINGGEKCVGSGGIPARFTKGSIPIDTFITDRMYSTVFFMGKTAN